MWNQLLCYCNAHDISPHLPPPKKKRDHIKIVDSSVCMQYHSLIIERKMKLHFIDVKRYMLNIEWINQTL